MVVNRDNQTLLNKLVEISSGKWSSVAPAPRGGKPAAAAPRSTSFRTTGLASLNIGVRKRETLRIEKENHAIARRLFEKGPTVTVNALQKDWRQNRTYRSNIRRV